MIGEDESIRKPLEVDSENNPVIKKIMFILVSPSFVLSFYNNLRHFLFIFFKILLYLCYAFIYAYYCPTRFPNQMIFVSLNSIMSATSGAENTKRSGTHEFTHFC